MTVLYFLLIIMRLTLACDKIVKWYDIDFPLDYNKLIPDISQGLPFNASIIIKMKQITGVNDADGTIEMLLEIAATWNDSRVLNSSDHCYYQIKTSEAEKIWKPAFYVVNSKTVDRMASHILPNSVADMTVINGQLHGIWDLTLELLCDFKLANYPFDIQKCNFFMTSKNLDIELLQLKYLQSFQKDFMFNRSLQRKLQYTIEFQDLEEDDKVIVWEGLNHSVIGFEIILRRKFTPYMFNIYLPSTGLVLISMFSFLISPDVVPGRMALLITIFLVLTNIGNSSRENSPTQGEATVIDLWLQSCQVFVSLALCEYGFLLYIIRKHQYKAIIAHNSKDRKHTPFKTHRLIKQTDDISVILFPLSFFIFLSVYHVVVTEQ